MSKPMINFPLSGSGKSAPVGEQDDLRRLRRMVTTLQGQLESERRLTATLRVALQPFATAYEKVVIAQPIMMAEGTSIWDSKVGDVTHRILTADLARASEALKPKA